MQFKLLKKLVGLFGYKIISKDLIKNNRLLNDNEFISLSEILNFLFKNKYVNSLIQIGANDGLRFDYINKYIKKYKTTCSYNLSGNGYSVRVKISYCHGTTLVVQIEPGPIPTLIKSTPRFAKKFAASAVAILPAHNNVFLCLYFLIVLIICLTFLVCP